MARTRLAVLIVALVAAVSRGEVSVPKVFGDHMVLQTGMKIPVWGKADPGEQVTVSINGQRQTTTAGDTGDWKVTLEPVTSNQPLEMLIEGKNQIRLSDILIGEVWICSGQSNMEWTLQRSADPEKEIAAAEFPNIRFFNVSIKKRPARTPQWDVDAEWTPCSPKTAKFFSAVGYHFARHIRERLDGVPVGLINVSWGGMPAEAFTDIPVLQADPELATILTNWQILMDRHPQAMELYQKQMAEWEIAAKAAEARREQPPRKPNQPVGPDNPSGPGNLWNGMIHPIKPFAVRGVIWYQGETNAPRAVQYRKLLPAMITSWRQAWGQDFPFLIVQLANFKPAVPDPVQDADWPKLREAQAMVVETVPATGLAVTIDIGEANDIHPKNKRDVGRRLGMAAEKIAYGRDVVYSGPTFKSMQVDGSRAVLTFDHVGGGLEARGGELKGFAVRAEGGPWQHARAVIDNDKVFISADGVDKPAAVRYAWADNPTATLYNKEGLPAVPFRTDRD